MREVYEIKPANLSKAQEVLGKDDLTSRQSMYVRTAVSLSIKSDNTYIILDGNVDALKKAEVLLKSLATKAKNKDDILKKFDAIENTSAEGFGFLGM
ncbi:hypothetical protein HY497_02140 [Candidatus Woesearchaeota archaeon]|nr:hypothetical protein [Candidatus Woesearchaeota archaeon]